MPGFYSRLAVFLVLLTLLADIASYTGLGYAQPQASPQEISREVEEALKRLEASLVPYSRALVVVRELEECAGSKSDALLLLLESLEAGIARVLEKGASRAALIEILSGLDNLVSWNKRLALLEARRVYGECRGSTLYYYFLILYSNPTSIGFLFSRERAEKLGGLSGRVGLLASIPLYTSRLDEDYWSNASSLLGGSRDNYCLFFSKVDARAAPGWLLARASRIVLGSVGDPFRAFQEATEIVYRLIREGGSGECAAAALNIVEALYGNTTEPLAPLYESIYVGEYAWLSWSKQLLYRKYTPLESLRRTILSFLQGSETLGILLELYPYNFFYSLSATSFRSSNGGAYSTMASLVSSAIVARVGVSRGSQFYPDPLALAIIGVGSRIAWRSMAEYNNTIVGRALVAAMSSSGRDSAVMWGVAGYAGLVDAYRSGELAPLLRTLVVNPLSLGLVDNETMRAFLPRISGLGVEPVWLIGLRYSNQPDHTVLAFIGVERPVLGRELGCFGACLAGRLKELIASYSQSLWSRYWRLISKPVSRSEISLVRNTTGVESIEDSLLLFKRIAAGEIRAENATQAGWLARAASLRSTREGVVLVVPLARLAAALLLEGINDTLSNIALGWSSASGLSSVERWATCIDCSIIPSWTKSISSNTSTSATASLEEGELLKEVSELVNKTRESNPSLARLLEDYYRALEEGNYTLASRVAYSLREYLEEHGGELDPYVAEAIARIASVNVTSSGLTIDLDKYSSIIAALGETASQGSSSGSTGAKKSFLESLAEAIREKAEKYLGEKVVELIRLHGGREIAEMLSSLQSGGSAGKARDLISGLGSSIGRIIGGSSGALLPFLPAPPVLEAPIGLSASSGLIGALIVALVALGLLASVFALRRLRVVDRIVLWRAERAIARGVGGAKKAGSLREEIVEKFAVLLDVYSKKYARRLRSETHREYGRRLPRPITGVYSDAALAYEEAKFSEHEVGVSHLERIVRAIREGLKRVHRS